MIVICSDYDSFQAYNSIYHGKGANDNMVLIGNEGWNSDPNAGTEVDVSMTGHVETSTTPTDLTITMICLVGVDGCSEASTAETHSNGITEPPDLAHVTTTTPAMNSETTASETKSNDAFYSVTTTGIAIPLGIEYH